MATTIYILSQPIQSGKTTLLMQWIRTQQAVAGILTPDIAGKRKLYDIEQQTYYDLQLPDDAPGVRIGRFTFDASVFRQAGAIIQSAVTRHPQWIVVDEIGRLETEQQAGLEPDLSSLIHFFKTNTTSTKLLLVIRDYLLDDVRKHYGIEDAIVLPNTFFLAQTPSGQHPPEALKTLAGLVLCGGQSVRMGTDKAFIAYHSKPQYVHVAQLMRSFCKDVYISCNAKQSSLISPDYQSLIDNATFKDAGPLTGVLSAFSAVDASSLLVIGCDYPHFTQADMKALIDARSEEVDVVCYHHPESGFDEPLLAIYEQQCAPLLFQFYRNGHTSLQQFLTTVRTKRILPVSTQHIQSVDVPFQL